MQSFQISAAKHINREYSVKAELTDRRRGNVFVDRYHQEIIKTPRQARRSLAYVLNNWRKHKEDRADFATDWPIDPYSSAASKTCCLRARLSLRHSPLRFDSERDEQAE
jgi:hypothetical protein